MSQGRDTWSGPNLASVVVLFFTLIGASVSAQADTTSTAKNFGELRPFWTDACTNFPDGTPSQPDLWERCCIAHDLKYWAGGTLKEKTDADGALYTCVNAAGGPVVASMMVAGVAVGGSPYLDTYFRWGYGWPKMRGFNALSADEQAQVQSLTPADLWSVPVSKTPVYE